MDAATEFREYVLSSVRYVFSTLPPGRELMPVAFVLSEEISILPIGHFFKSDEGKSELMAKLRLVAEHPVCRGIAFVSEIWLAKATALEGVKTPSQCSERTEAAMVRLEARNSGVEVWIAPISVNPDGTRSLAEFKILPSEGGRMAEALFPENRQGQVTTHEYHVC